MRQLLKNVNEKAQYDAYAKKILSNKIFLAHILKGTIPELGNMRPAEIIPLIEGEALVSKVPTEPGLTNRQMKELSHLITGNNTENTEPDEGTATFDIIFYMCMPDGRTRMIINLEAQKDALPGYPLMNRGVFYTSRMISSQKERDFVGSHYEAMLNVYSIWLCFNMSENCINHFYIADKAIMGDYMWPGNRNLFHIVLVGLDKKYTAEAKQREMESDLHRMLAIIFSDTLNGEEKVYLLQEELQILVDEEVREELDEMCNLSYGIEERGIARGIKQGIEKGIEKGKAEAVQEMICKMLIDHMPVDKIKLYADVDDQAIARIEEQLSALTNDRR